MKKKKIIIVMISIIIIAILILLIARLVQYMNIEKLDTSFEERTLWNDFLNENPYLSQISTISNMTERNGKEQEKSLFDDDLIHLAITSSAIEKSETQFNNIRGYKVSRKSIKNYLDKLLTVEDVNYTRISTFVKEEDFLIIDYDYVYFSEIKLPKKMYIAKNYEIDSDGNYSVEINEYNVTEENKEDLDKALNEGIINKKVEVRSQYILTGTVTDKNNIQIQTKTKSTDKLTEEYNEDSTSQYRIDFNEPIYGFVLEEGPNGEK